MSLKKYKLSSLKDKIDAGAEDLEKENSQKKKVEPLKVKSAEKKYGSEKVKN